jgi:hypothetical protein
MMEMNSAGNKTVREPEGYRTNCGNLSGNSEGKQWGQGENLNADGADFVGANFRLISENIGEVR